MFNTFKKILSGQTIQESDADKVSQFILLRWLSGDPRLLPLAITLNQCNNLDNLALCQAIQSFLKGKVNYIKYPTSKKKDKEILRDAQLFAMYFEVGLTEAKEYLEWCKRNCPGEIKALREIYQVSTKE